MIKLNLIKFLVILAVIIFYGCEDPLSIRTIDVKTPNSLGKFPYNSTIDELTVVEIDSCEYIVCNAYRNRDVTITHKGNCKFCIKRSKK